MGVRIGIMRGGGVSGVWYISWSFVIVYTMNNIRKVLPLLQIAAKFRMLYLTSSLQ